MDSKIGDKVKCVKYLCYEIKMDKIYTVSGVQEAFDDKVFIHLKELKNKISYCADNFKRINHD